MADTTQTTNETLPTKSRQLKISEAIGITVLAGLAIIGSSFCIALGMGLAFSLIKMLGFGP